VRLTALPPEALPRALAISTLIGWNQTAADWRVFLEHGRVMALDDGEPEMAATVATLDYGPVAWVSMVLVRPDRRRQGLARAAMQWAVASLREEGARCIALDATPDGREVYRRLGFADGWGFTRWNIPPLPPMPGPRPMTEADLPAVLALDMAAFGADRAWLLAGRPGFVIEEGGRIVAAVMLRDGTRWPHAGPLWAREPRHAQALLAAALPGGGIADLRDGLAILPWLEEELGAPMRPFTRMVLDGALPAAGEGCMAVLGPEFG
jgi:GNAT superfamily N-acetyltransferase